MNPKIELTYKHLVDSGRAPELRLGHQLEPKCLDMPSSVPEHHPKGTMAQMHELAARRGTELYGGWNGTHEIVLSGNGLHGMGAWVALLHQTEVTAILGSACDGDKAKKSRRIIIKTGIKRNNKGGGDNGGNTSGSTSKDTVNTTMATIDLKLNSLTINFYAEA
ncbi:hypothetical protein NC652_015343 [Populus alba x Populus x berolinensis]|nr:hypothetical protein NC652_015343 [Populus alba x Populus x berolinensis]